MTEGHGARRREVPELVSVVIPARNAAKYLGEQLESLTRQDYRGRFEVVVAENGSDDATAEVAAAFADRLDLRVLDVPRPHGAGAARNAGVRATHGQLLAFADADDVTSPEWLTSIVRAAADFDLVGGAYDLSVLNSSTVQSWRTPRPLDHLPISHGFLAYAPGGNLGVWRDVFDDVGGFDSGFSQDVAFSWLAQAKGWRLGFADGAIVHYRWRSTLRGMALQRYRWGYSEIAIESFFRAHGLHQRPPWKDVLEVGKHVVTLPVVVFDPKRRGNRLGRLAYLLGRLHGRLGKGQSRTGPAST